MSAAEELSMNGKGCGGRYSLAIATAGGGLTAAEICAATMKAKTTAGTHISRKN